MSDGVDTLVIAAHPDDEVLGCGGTIARLARESTGVAIAILGEGVTSRHARRDQADAHALENLHANSRSVADHLGACELSLHRLPDNRFDSLPLLDVVKIVEELIDRHQPAVIYTHHPGDLNIDHVVTHRAVLMATRPVPGHSVREVYAFEIPSSTEWAFGQFAPPFRPNVFVDIAATFETKIEAMQMYESEARDFPHPRSPEALRAAARRWGSVVGRAAVEAFELIKALR